MSVVDPLLELRNRSAQARPGNPIHEKGRGLSSEIPALALGASLLGKARFGTHNEDPNKSSKVDQPQVATPMFVAKQKVEKVAAEPARINLNVEIND